MPAYEIWLEKAAERDLKRLDDRLFSQVIRKIRELKINPRPAGAKKLIGSGNDWRIRAGDHRVIYEIDDGNRVVKVFRVRHRKEVYRR